MGVPFGRVGGEVGVVGGGGVAVGRSADQGPGA